MSDARYAVIIPAAGRSSRFGGVEKKPFVSLDGRAIWLRSAELFWKREDVSKVYLVISPDDRDEFRARFGHLLAFANAEVVDGGAERFDSVFEALRRIPDEIPFVAIHDAVRPLTTQAVIDAVFAEAQLHDAVIPAIPVADTLKQVDPQSHCITGTVPRAGVWQAQTPQVFRRELLLAAYAHRVQHGLSVTDDAQLLESMGHPVRVVPGALINFKITTREDFTLAEAAIRAQTRRAEEARPTPGAFDDDVKW